MHFFKNSVSFIAVMCVFGAAYAAVAPARGRVGVVATHGTASRRLPSLINILRPGTASTGTTTTTTTTTTTSVALLSDQECVDKYRECMKGGNACGAGFEECTTNVLFHGHMGECFSTLYQCSGDGLTALFGTDNLVELSEVDSYVDGTNDTEVARYTYPTDGSIMGMDIIGAATRNKLSTADCVKKYKKCLNKDTVCGEDFELCTTPDEFRRQAAMCDSTLARCQKEGFQQLFGDAQMVKPVGSQLAPADGSTLQWINEGASLAATNAVNTCYKVIDSCFTNACKRNPYRCVEGANPTVVAAADWVGGDAERVYNVQQNEDGTTTQSSSDVRKFFRSACESTIGGNKYCFMTFREGATPSKADLLDEDNQSDVFDDAYNARKPILQAKVKDAVDKFNKGAQEKCLDTFESCAVSSCGGGSGAACYASVFKNGDVTDDIYSINRGPAYTKVYQGCAGVVNTNPNCIYMAAVNGIEDYSFDNFDASREGAFDVLFPKYTDSADAGKTIVAALNSQLSAAYNDVAIEQMKKQCQTFVENCAKSMCGTDFQNCYRNRTDIYSGAYTSGTDTFQKSMNKMGGVLDYTIVQGLCGSTVRSSEICAESLAIAKVGLDNSESTVTAGWGANPTTLTNAWRKSAALASSDNNKVNDVDANGHRRCECDGGRIDICASESGATDMTCTTPHMVDRSALLENTAVATLFQDVLDIVDQEAQAKYKAKLTKEQNICLAQNGGSSLNSSFVWAKLRDNNTVANIPQYETKGLQDFAVPSNELFGSFCRIKIDLRSDDRDVQNLLNGETITLEDIKGASGFLAWGSAKFGSDDDRRTKSGKVSGDGNATTAYFSAGDTFTCGSWVSDDTLDAITEKVRYDAYKEAGAGSVRDQNVKLWTTLGLGTAGAIAGYFGMDAIQGSNTSLGGLLKRNDVTTDGDLKDLEKCMDAAVAAKKAAEAVADADVKNVTSRITSLRQAISKLNTEAKKGGVSKYIASSIPALNSDKNNLDEIKASVGDNGLIADIDEVAEQCSDRYKSGNEWGSWNDSARHRQFGRNAIAGASSAVATTLLTAGIIGSAQKAKYEEAADSAVKEWMDSVGKKIHCYVNGQKVGDFGDIVTIRVDAE